MGNTVPPRASREATGSPGGRRSDNVVTEVVAPPATPSRVVATARNKQRRDDDVEEEEPTRAGRPCAAGGALRAGGGDGAALGPAPAGKVLTVKIVMSRKDAEALVARLKVQSARERKARMAVLKGELRAGSCCGGGGGGASPAWSRDARRPRLPPIKENRF